MGLLAALQKGTSIQKGETTITTDLLLGIDEMAITPTKPGEFGIHRTTPVITKPRSFTVQEANALGSLAEKRAIEAKASAEAFGHLRKINKADQIEQNVHNNYRVDVAKKTFKQVQSNASAGNQIAGLSSQYAQIHESVRHRLDVEQAKNSAISGKSQEYSKLW